MPSPIDDSGFAALTSALLSLEKRKKAESGRFGSFGSFADFFLFFSFAPTCEGGGNIFTSTRGKMAMVKAKWLGSKHNSCDESEMARIKA